MCFDKEGGSQDYIILELPRQDKDFDKAGFNKVLRVRPEEFKFFEEARWKGQTHEK
ncbi:hypothetical protein MtrunA17_Chr7g0219381 [Medicago truncatula]|uniref:Uncharacterized protein n=1 Tax=Medicago truncatula TaxID=3880 RepID=A0A396GTI4_MEDTR|nr:hypothetical protein MtrunA17_Chr7g0219381 [Medicago truncatula]